MAEAPSSAPRRDVPLRERLAEAARVKPSGGRAKWIVWGLVGGTVLVIGVLQMFGVIPSPVAERVLEERRKREKAAQRETPPPPAETTPSAPDAPK